MNNAELARLKALALAATPGPWYGFFDGVRLAPEVFGQKNISRYVCGVMGTTGNNTTEHYNAAYIAAASPDVVLALIERIEALTRANLELTRRYADQKRQEKRLELALEKK